MAPICIEPIHYVEERDEAFEIAEVDLGCDEDKIVIQMYCVGGFIREESSMALISIGLYGKPGKQQRLSALLDTGCPSWK